jgi:Asp-tRNA(Asn)/Glu-tRNA(Gln) amidotransferase A subunit family amidase
MPDFPAIRERHGLIVAAEAGRTHQDWYAQYPGGYHAKTRELIEHGLTISDEALETAKTGRAQLRNELTALMDEHEFDLWISPSAPGAAPAGLDSTGDPVMNLPWTHSGLPTLGLPSRFNPAGLPLGIQLAGRFGTDEILFKMGSLVNQSLKETMKA